VISENNQIKSYYSHSINNMILCLQCMSNKCVNKEYERQVSIKSISVILSSALMYVLVSGTLKSIRNMITVVKCDVGNR
jgi:hypothetical protein